MKEPLKADSPTKLRVACLDGLRPLLIFWVISFHWEPTGTTAKPWPTFLAPLTWTVKNYGRYQSDASKYDSVDLRTLHGSGFPLTLLMLQSWWPVFERDSSAHPYHGHKWKPDPHGVVFVPYAVDYTLWRGSSGSGPRRAAPHGTSGAGADVEDAAVPRARSRSWPASSATPWT
ncbi:hypothetical protein JL721_2851 [Aureococcus anophagefferens]|nr:hypothetical protein JL721_2851 [Aureococcus anophagefferens]